MEYTKVVAGPNGGAVFDLTNASWEAYFEAYA